MRLTTADRRRVSSSLTRELYQLMVGGEGGDLKWDSVRRIKSAAGEGDDEISLIARQPVHQARRLEREVEGRNGTGRERRTYSF